MGVLGGPKKSHLSFLPHLRTRLPRLFLITVGQMRPGWLLTCIHSSEEAFVHQLEHLPCPARRWAEKVEMTASMCSVPLLPLQLRTQAQWGAVTWGRVCRSQWPLPRRRKDPPACNESLLHPHLRELRTLGTLPPPLFLPPGQQGALERVEEWHSLT